jgi:transcriptional regulator with XRE-family HTH domain
MIEKKWEAFGTLLKAEMKRNHLSRKDLSKKINRKESTIISWEQGYRRPTQPSFLALHNILGTSIQELQKLAGHTPEFDWNLSLSEVSNKGMKFLLKTNDEEREELRKYLHYIRFKKILVSTKY